MTISFSPPPTPKPLNLTWAGAGLGVFTGGGISSLWFLLFMLVSTISGSIATEADVSAMWLFGAFFCIGSFFPAAVIGALLGATMGTIYKRRPRQWNGLMATGLGVGMGLVVLGFSYLSLRALVGESEWTTFLERYWDTGGILLFGGYEVLVILGFTLLSHLLNRRLP